MNEKETLGLIVQVSPVIWWSDHVSKIGTIVFTDFDDNKAWVEFDDEEVDHFSPKLLFILRGSEGLMQLSEKYKSVNWPPVSQNLKTLAMLQASGSKSQLKAAYELLQDDPELHREATIRLNEVIDLNLKIKPVR